MAEWLGSHAWGAFGNLVFAAAPAKRPAATPRETALWYVALALLTGAIVVGVLVAVRLWREIHEDEEPATNNELLDEFRLAYAQGEIDEAEFQRVTALLTKSGGGEPHVPMRKAESTPPLDNDAVQPPPAASDPGAAPSV